jgi:hypothetical protein
MSFFEPDIGEAFTFRVVKSHTLNPSLKWENLYEVRNRTAAVPADLVTAGMDVVAFEQALHYDFVQFETLTVSTWVPDGVPYNPDSFVTVPIGSTGERTLGSDPVSLVHCLRAQMQVESGRMGFRLYRGCLAEGEIQSPAGISVFQNPAAMNTLVSTAVSDNISEFVGTATGIVQLVLESNSNSRNVVAVNAVGITFKKLNNKFFNRQPAP